MAVSGSYLVAIIDPVPDASNLKGRSDPLFGDPFQGGFRQSPKMGLTLFRADLWRAPQTSEEPGGGPAWPRTPARRAGIQAEEGRCKGRSPEHRPNHPRGLELEGIEPSSVERLSLALRPFPIYGFAAADGSGPLITEVIFRLTLPGVNVLSRRQRSLPAVLHRFCCRAAMDRPRVPLLVAITLLV